MEAFVNVGYDPQFDVLCAVDPGVTDLYNAVFFTKPDELVQGFTKSTRFEMKTDGLRDVNLYLPDNDQSISKDNDQSISKDNDQSISKAYGKGTLSILQL